VDVHDRLTELTHLVEDARAMPMSASALVNRAEVLGFLDEIRELLPEELHHADVLLADRESVMAQGQAEANRLITAAQAEHQRLVAATEVMRAAEVSAHQVLAQAEVEAGRLRAEADDYVDRKLGEFEIVLDKLTQQVHRGRDRLATRAPGDPGSREAGPSDYTVDLTRLH
jgi:cell division septum initiation protein DivIVA